MNTKFDNEENMQESTNLAHEFAIEDHNTCCLCGTDLKFEHKIDYMTLVVNESATCPSCRIQMRKRDYVLQ